MKLPAPITITEYYLAAILAELERLNATMDQLAQRSSSQSTPSTAPVPDAARLKEKRGTK